MKILIVGNFSEHSLDLSYSKAFKKAGCFTFHFDYADEYKKLTPFSQNKILSKLVEPFFCKTLNVQLINLTKETKPDLVFVIKGFFIYPETIKQIKLIKKTLVFNFNPDDPFNTNKGASNEFIRSSIPFYDCYLIWGKSLMQKLLSAGAKQVEYLPYGFDPDLCFSVEVSHEDKEKYGSDILFNGTWDKDRERWLEGISGYDLTIYGAGWEKLDKKSALRKKYKGILTMGELLAKVYGTSKIVLNMLREQNLCATNLKTFEIPACKGFMLINRTVELNDFFIEGEDLGCFENIEELKDKIDFFLTRDALRKIMSLSAYQKVQKHNCYERVKKILQIFKKDQSSYGL